MDILLDAIHIYVNPQFDEKRRQMNYSRLAQNLDLYWISDFM